MPLMRYREYARHRGVTLHAVQKAIVSGRIDTIGEGRERKIDVDQADEQWPQVGARPHRRHYGSSAGEAAFGSLSASLAPLIPDLFASTELSFPPLQANAGSAARGAFVAPLPASPRNSRPMYSTLHIDAHPACVKALAALHEIEARLAELVQAQTDAGSRMQALLASVPKPAAEEMADLDRILKRDTPQPYASREFDELQTQFRQVSADISVLRTAAARAGVKVMEARREATADRLRQPDITRHLAATYTAAQCLVEVAGATHALVRQLQADGYGIEHLDGLLPFNASRAGLDAWRAAIESRCGAVAPR